MKRKHSEDDDNHNKETDVKETDVVATIRNLSQAYDHDQNFGRDLQTLIRLVKCLRDPEHGCPWDSKQTLSSITPYTIEEAYEVAEAIGRDDSDDICDELGDLLLQVILLSQIASEADRFELKDVIQVICKKLVRRHPHIFGDDDRLKNQGKAGWEAIKAQEKADKRARKQINANNWQPSTLPPTIFDGISPALPPLLRARKLQEAARRIGFDWPHAHNVLDKIREETSELEAAIDQGIDNDKAIKEEFGDLLFTCINLGRKLGLDCEQSLAEANTKFVTRFQLMEQKAAQCNQKMESMTLDELDNLWNKIKQS